MTNSPVKSVPLYEKVKDELGSIRDEIGEIDYGRAFHQIIPTDWLSEKNWDMDLSEIHDCIWLLGGACISISFSGVGQKYKCVGWLKKQ